jgi:guanylate kinase
MEKIVIVSGPSGVGKTTVMREVFRQSRLPLRRSVSATTREPRPDEIDGKDYYFLTDDEFKARRERGDFLESFQVFGKDHWYGTPWSEIEAGFRDGKWVVLEIDVQGALKAMERFPEAVSIFIHPGSMEELERRLRGRGTETEEVVRRRLDRAREEFACAPQYRHQVYNRRVEQTAAEIDNILNQEWEKTRHD